MFTYLSSSISSTESDDNVCLAKAWTASDRLLIIWKSGLSDKVKQDFFQTVTVLELLLDAPHGCQRNAQRKN